MSEIITLFTDEGNPLTPLEAATGIPLPIWAPGDGKTNDHHAYFRKVDWEKRGTLEQRALRFSRLQAVRKKRHRAFHENYFEGTPFPDQSQESFAAVLLNSVGYIPSYVVDMNTSEPRIIETTPKIREELKKSGIFKLEKRSSKRADVGKFLMQYAVWQKFDDEKISKIEEFLSITPEQAEIDEIARQRRYNLGLRLARKAIGIAVEPLYNGYKEARMRHVIRDSAPVSPFLAVKDIMQGYEEDYFEPLRQNLELTYGKVS
jgi:hypothetical protein